MTSPDDLIALEGGGRSVVHRRGDEEYARHNGHADLIRERLDGATGT